MTFYFCWQRWDADTLFDVIEVMHDLVSKPIEGRLHDINGCGWHYETFNRTDGQAESASSSTPRYQRALNTTASRPASTRP